MTYADLELSLRRWSGDDYALELRFQLATSGVEAQLISGPPPRVRIDFEGLDALRIDSHAYGERLTGLLCADMRVHEAFAKARSQAQSLQAPLRLRLRLAAEDDAIHSLRWETLHDPEHGGFLCTSERVLVSRYLDSPDMTPLVLQPRADLRALIVVASPQGLENYRLAPVDMVGEVVRSQTALDSIPATVLAQSQGQRATLANLAAALRDGPDILYLVAHGTFRRGHPYLWLEQDDGQIDRIEGDELVEMIEHLARRPLLVVLASCQSASSSHDEGALSALGPRLAAAGIAATVAMQGDVTMATVERFMPIFFRELQRDGQVDRALAAARAAVLDRPDWWMPVLFLRVRDGQLWSVPGTVQPATGIPPLPPPERPPQVAGFVGRATELAAFEARLATYNVAIITGVPGVGKTSLAAMLARKVATTDAIFWHSFNAGEGIDTVVWGLAAFLAYNGQAGLWSLLQGARQSGGQPPPPKVLFDYLLELLHGKDYLLCFDDFSFIDQDPQIEQLLERLRPELDTGGARLILTSRRVPEFIQDFVIDELAGLSERDMRLLLEARGVTLADNLIVDLYAQTSGNAQLVNLAAASLRHADDPAQVISRLIETDDIERYLLHEVDATLGEDERRVMQAAATLLDYGGTRNAIEALLDGPSARRTLRALSDRYLLLAHEGPAGKEYRLHAMVQPFYYNGLSKRERIMRHRQAGQYYETEERDLLRAALHYDHAGDYTRAADLATADVWAAIDSGRARALHQLLERFFVRQIEPDTARHLDPERWAAVQVALGAAHYHIGESEQARQTYEEAFSYLASLPASSVVVKLRASVCIGIADLLQYEAPRLALSWLQRGLEAVGERALPEQTAALYIRKGTIQGTIGDYVAALDAVQRGLELLPAGPSYWRVSALINLGRIAFYQGDLKQAIVQTERAWDLSQQLHDYYRMITIFINLSAFKDFAGDWEGALATYHQAAELAEQLGSQAQRVQLELNLGLLYINRGDDEAAMSHLTGSLALAHANKIYEYELICKLGLADLHLRRGQPAVAAPLLDEVEQLALETDNKSGLQEAYHYRAQVHLSQGELQIALQDVDRALTLARELDHPVAEALGLRVQGQALCGAGQHEAALAAFGRSLQLLADDPYEAARTQVQWGLALRAHAEVEQGASMLREARATFERLGAKRDLAEVDAALSGLSSDVVPLASAVYSKAPN